MYAEIVWPTSHSRDGWTLWQKYATPGVRWWVFDPDRRSIYQRRPDGPWVTSLAPGPSWETWRAWQDVIGLDMTPTGGAAVWADWEACA